MQPPNWYVLTGAPSSGKSTTIEALAKTGYATVPEMARVWIENEMAKGRSLKELETDSMQFEEEVLRLKVAKEKELDPGTLTFFDRGMHDTLAYYDLYGWPKDAILLKACEQAIYKKVFLLEMLDYVDDGVRVESEEASRKLQDLFLKVYTEAGYDVIVIPKGAVEQRVEEILRHVDKT